MAIILPEKESIRSFINNQLQRHFDKQVVNFDERVTIISDKEKWKVDEIADMRADKQNNLNFYGIYFDNEFVCRMSSKTSPMQFELMFFRGITKLYESGKIHFIESEYKEEGELIKQVKKDKTDFHKSELKKIDKMKAPIEVKEALKGLEKDNFKKSSVTNEELDFAGKIYKK